jgi:biopolymer transport protein ExbD
MTPMIDVVFLLIIFFLVSSHLARQESRIPLDLPTAVSHLPTDFETASLTINVMDDGSWQVAGRTLDLTSLVGALVDHHNASGSGSVVRIRTDRTVPYDRIEPVLREAAKAGLANVSIAVTRGDVP